jgi:hypothetical protein
MIAIPQDDPVLKHLNSYYLDLHRLIEHCQGELGAGGIHFRSVFSQGVIFFDQDQIVNALLEEKEISLEGERATWALVESSANKNYSVDVYRLDETEVYFWASIASRDLVHEETLNVTGGFDELLKDLTQRRFTGYAQLNGLQGGEVTQIFFNSGRWIGRAYLAHEGERIVSSVIRVEEQKRGVEASLGVGPIRVFALSPTALLPRHVRVDTETNSRLLQSLEALVNIFEMAYANNGRSKPDFSVLLRKRFIQKAERFPCLDPFAGELTYTSGKMILKGSRRPAEVAQGVVESLYELGKALGIMETARLQMNEWLSKYAAEYGILGIRFPPGLGVGRTEVNE